MPHQCTSCGRAFADGSKEMLSGCPNCGGNKFQFMPAGAADGSDGGGAGPATAPKKAPEDAPPADAPETRGEPGDPSGGRADGPGGRESAPPETGGHDRASAVNRAAATVRDWVGRRDDSERSAGSGSPVTDDALTPEDSAQASARRDVVSKSELPDAASSTDSAAARTAGTSPTGDNSERSRTAGDSSVAPDAATTADSRTTVDSATAPDSSSVGDAADEDNVVDAPDDRNPGLEQLREELNSQFESIRIVNPGQYELNLMELYEREEYIISLQEDGKYVIEVPDAWDASER